MLRHAHFYINGGNRTFAAGANQIGQLEESRRSERRASFFDVQMQPMAARSPFFYRPNPKLSLCLELPLSLQNQAKLQILKAALCCFSNFKS